MKDIVEKLYDGSVCSPAQNYYYNHTAMQEAANEIERLREVVSAFMTATSDETGWGHWNRMDSPELYIEIADARMMAIKITPTPKEQE